MIREVCEWYEIPVDHYLDQRYRNWKLAEEFGDVLFDYERGVVLVHRVRAEHIARALGVYSQTPASGPPSPAPERRSRAAAPAPLPVAETRTTSRWRDIVDWLGILAGVAVFVASLAVPLDDAAFAVMLALWLRGLRTVYMPVSRGV